MSRYYFYDGSYRTFEYLQNTYGITRTISYPNAQGWYNPELNANWIISEQRWEPVVEDTDWGIMTDVGDTSYKSPHGTIDMSYLELVYGGGEQQYMIENPEVKGYLRSSAYQSSNRNLSANTEYYLYASGSDATVDGDSQHTYILKGAFTAAGVSVSIAGASLIVSGSKLKLVWGPTGASVCYITYT